ncbi:MAG: thrombospondin type 3 repeat-containing protein [Candidatus Jacksonbacteria bacterium]
MFEDQTPQTLPPKKPVPLQPPVVNLAQKPPDNLPIGGGLEELPEDIFAGSDSIKIAQPAPLEGTQNIPEIPGDINQLPSRSQPLLPAVPHHASAISRKVLIFILSAVLIAFLIIASYLVYRIIKARNNTVVYNESIPVSQPETQEIPAQIEEETEPQPEPIAEPEPTIPQPPPEPEPEPTAPLDSDGDGLTDLLELEIGSNPQVIDTDLDGLDDYSEVKVYGSNPVKRDTDGDGYDDGTEVENGYSPIGSEKL